jgi:osmotically-inducible protein OsmY
MKRHRSRRPGGAGAILLGVLCAGCPQLLITKGVTTAASIIADDRSLAQQTADMELEARIERALVDESAAAAAHVNVDVFLGRVMLTGVADDATRWIAARTARRIAREGEVWDDVEIGTGGDVADTAEEAAANKALGLALLADDGIASQSLLHRVVNGTAFVMGEVQEEGQVETVRSIVRQAPGIHRVVTHIVLEGD